jgi:uncharacterized cupin superfamily protein
MHPHILNLNSVELEPLPESFAPTGETAGRYQQRHLAVSTQQSPEVCEYPDSGKYAVMDDFKVDAEGNASGFVAVARQADGVDYWDGE